MRLHMLSNVFSRTSASASMETHDHVLLNYVLDFARCGQVEIPIRFCVCPAHVIL
jgi:hypothetical protein